MAEIDIEELSNLYTKLTAQSQTLLIELNQFQQYIATHPSSPDIALNKFLTDVIRETNLLAHHGAALGLISTLSEQEPASSQYTNAPLRTSLARMQKSETSPSNSIHRIRSSNIGFLAAVWAEMKRNRGVVAVRKQVRYLPDSQPLGPVSTRTNQDAREREKERRHDSINRDRQGMGGSMAKVPRRVRGSDGVVRRADKEPVTVDVVAEHGARWVKIVTKNTGWLIMDLAKEGLVEIGGSDDEGVEDQGENANSEQDGSESTVLDELKLCRIAKEFLAAAKTARVGPSHEHPKVHFYLTKIERDVSKDVDAVLRRIEQFGITVKTARELVNSDSHEDIKERSVNGETSALIPIFERMTAEATPSIYTDILNIDCTILIALISDISHQDRSNIIVPNHYDGRQAGKDIDYQLKTEPEDPLLPNDIYPILCGKRLICTSKAATHLRNIVRIMGSETETKRSNLFLPVGPEDFRKGKDLRCELQKTSIHDVPENLQLPIGVVESESLEDECSGQDKKLEVEIRRRLAMHPRLSPLNQSVFFHGWRSRMTTVSLNRVVSEWLDRAIDATLDDIEREENCSKDVAVDRGFEGPQVLICGRERSLLGNEK